MYKVSVVTPFHNVDIGMFQEGYMSYHLTREVLSNLVNPMDSPSLMEARNGWLDMMGILRDNVTTDYGRRYHFDQIETLADYQLMVPMTNYEHYKRLIDLQTNIGESGILTTEPTRLYLVNAKPLNDNDTATLLSTDTKPGDPYQLVVTNSAGLYRYVTDHIVCIQEKQIDKILFTIY